MDYDPFDPAVKRDPYPYYAELRRHAPVFRVAARGLWSISRHADVGFALKRPDLFSSSPNADRAELPASSTLLGSDPPAHTRLRKRIERSFTPRRVRELAARLDSLVTELTGAFAARGACDAIAALASPLPIIMIAELMGIDPKRHDDFKRWADAVIVRGTGRPSTASRGELDECVAEFKAFLGDAIDARRRAPGDDLLSALVRDAPGKSHPFGCSPGAPTGDDGGDALSPAEALNFAVLLLLGGSETTTNLIGNALAALFADEGALAQVAADPSLIVAVVEETLRFDAPVQSVLRRTTSEVELAGARLAAGETVLLLLGSANRDESVFPDADRFRLDRGELKNLAFGAGPHYCLGATLARMEANAALRGLLRLPNLRRASDEIELVDSFVLRGPRSLAIAFDRASP